jgi:hypothetical protein
MRQNMVEGIKNRGLLLEHIAPPIVCSDYCCSWLSDGCSGDFEFHPWAIKGFPSPLEII